MSAPNPATPPLEPMRLLSCVLPDDGGDQRLIRAVRAEWGIQVADSIACRGVAAVHRTSRGRFGRLPQSNFVKLVQILVPESQAEALFDYVYRAAQIGRPEGGMLLLGRPIQATPFRLPDDLPEEAG
jgi:hypothetical protein